MIDICTFVSVAVEFANEIVDAAVRITKDDIENAAVLVKRHFQEVGEFLRDELAIIGGENKYHLFCIPQR